MNLQNEREVANTREKLLLLEEEYADLRDNVSEDPNVREVAMRSLKRLMNQLTEEIACYEAHLPDRR